uniref:RNA-directed DNA polymerase n=1 Tax=Panagrolaimus davidi TaxID=227884 RepID=A0A914P660_9BILA
MSSTSGWTMPMFSKESKWEVWKAQLEVYIAARALTSKKSKALALLQCLNPDIFEQVIDWVAPDQPHEKDYDVLINLLQSKFSSKPNLLALRVKFLNEKQEAGQATQEYFGKLTQLVGKCDIKNMSAEDFAVLVILKGISNDELRQYLMMPTHDISTAEKVQQLALSFEQSKQAALDIKNECKPKTFSLNQLDKKRKVSKCYRCGGNYHEFSQCPAKDSVCHNCNKKGHFEKVCRSAKKPQKDQTAKFHRDSSKRKQQYQVDISANDEAGYATAYGNDIPSLLALSAKSDDYTPPIILESYINDVKVLFQHDSGAVCTVVNEKVWQDIGKPLLQPASMNLRSYNSNIPLLGQCKVKVKFEAEEKEAWLVIVKNGASLLGRNWIKLFDIRIEDELHGSCNQIQFASKLSAILDKYSEVFSKELGTCTIKAKLKLKEGAVPKFFKARNLPYALRDPVAKQLEEREAAGILTHVDHSEWATPIVPILKSNGDVRICGDYKSTLNPVLDVDEHPLPRIEDMFHELNGCTHFCKLDLRDAYHQIELEEESRELTTINTHKGLFRYNRLPFGTASAVAIFQKIMEKVVNGISKVVVFLDDGTIGGKGEQECLERLEQVLQRMVEHGLKLKLEKCEFLKTSLEFLGHELDKDGIRPSSKKLLGFKNMPIPQNLKQLEAFIGFVNYYGKFVKDFACLAAPLNDLRKKGVKWEWNALHQNAFDEIKSRLLKGDLLTHYDPAKEVVLATDASEYGIGAVLYHRESNGKELVIANASRKLTTAEQNYAQIEKEALAIVFGVEKFKIYLLGRKFVLLTDHQPLLRIFGQNPAKTTVALKRLQRWAILLMNYSYQIEYRKTTEFANADALSRLPDPTELPDPSFIENEREFQNLYHLDESRSPLNLDKLKEASLQDKEIQQILKFVKDGWPGICDKSWKSWWNRREFLSLGPGYLLFKDKPVIPALLRKSVLEMLHAAHVGRDRMLMLARDNFWYPGMTSDIGKLALACNICNGYKKGQPERLHPWETPNEFWDRIHIDYAGPFLGNLWLIVIDAKTNWLEVFKCTASDTKTTIKNLKSLFARYGLPKMIVSDNATCFKSSDFETFCETRGITHICSPPYHPQSNGEAERAVRTFKEWTERHVKAGNNLEEAVLNALLMYRTTRSTGNSLSPAESAFGKKLRTRMTLHEVFMQGKVDRAKFKVNDTVWVRVYSTGPRWQKGKIQKVTGSVTYLVFCNGQIVFRHADQIMRAEEFAYQIEDNVIPLSIGPSLSFSLHSKHSSSLHTSTSSKMEQQAFDLSFEDGSLTLSSSSSTTSVTEVATLRQAVRDTRKAESFIRKTIKTIKTVIQDLIDEYQSVFRNLEKCLARGEGTKDIETKLTELSEKLSNTLKAREDAYMELQEVSAEGAAARKALKEFLLPTPS